MMNIPRILGLGILLTLPLRASASEPVAIVYLLTGEASLSAPDAARRPLRLFDRLQTGTTVEVGPGSRLALAFANGIRYALEGGSMAGLGARDLTSRTGPVRPLPCVPTLPHLGSIAEADRPGPRAGAVRVRTDEIAGLYPNEAATLSGSTTLRFDPVDGGWKYRIEVQDRQGNKIFETETAASSVTLPAGVLRPATRYGWTVRTIDRVGSIARGKADFVTLSAELERRLPYLQSP
jgi:hypothetical protein